MQARAMLYASKAAVEQLHEGMAPYLRTEMHFYKPSLVRKHRLPRLPVPRDEQHFWLVHAASSSMRLQLGAKRLVIGVAMVFEHGIELTIFNDSYEQASNVSSTGAVACYKLYGTATDDDVWVLRVAKEF